MSLPSSTGGGEEAEIKVEAEGTWDAFALKSAVEASVCWLALRLGGGREGDGSE